MTRSLLEKLGVKENSEVIIINGTADFLKEFAGVKVKLKKRLVSQLDYIHCFFENEKEVMERFSEMKAHLKPEGMFWLSWQKSGRGETDLSMTKIIKMGYDFGMVESKTVSIDKDWSAIKFTFPKPGKTYKNSFGTLK